MTSNRGKLFEREFRKGLLLLPGMGIRLYDGTNVARVQMPGDFIYASTKGATFLIECKSTQENSLPYANFSEHQLVDLHEWRHPYTRSSIVAIEYWKHRRAFLLKAEDVIYEKSMGTRKSLPIDRAAELGIEIERVRGRSGFYYLLDALE